MTLPLFLMILSIKFGGKTNIMDMSYIGLVQWKIRGGGKKFQRGAKIFPTFFILEIIYIIRKVKEDKISPESPAPSIILTPLYFSNY